MRVVISVNCDTVSNLLPHSTQPLQLKVWQKLPCKTLSLVDHCTSSNPPGAES